MLPERGPAVVLGARRTQRLDELAQAIRAGVSKIGPVADLAVDGWSAMIDVNLRGVLHRVAACAAPELVAAVLTCGLGERPGWGRIAVCVFSSPVSDHGPGLRLVGAAGA